jgi:hypothetical protein
VHHQRGARDEGDRPAGAAEQPEHGQQREGRGRGAGEHARRGEDDADEEQQAQPQVADEPGRPDRARQVAHGVGVFIAPASV